MTPGITRPTRRSLRVYAHDPMLADLNDTIVTLSVPYETLRPGPIGSLVKVIDYDPVRDTWYSPVDLDDPLVLAQDGVTPSESDPRAHQQMVYAVASSVLEHFEAALGRRFRFTSGPLELFPHAFRGENAYYDSETRRVLFGYFPADRERPGPMLPGQMVFTCLSHDVVTHELSHAIVDRLRPRLMDATNHDVAAFHEAFSDLVALLHHFTLPDLVRRYLAASRSDLSSAGPLVDFARQFGEAIGTGAALRSGVDKPDPRALSHTLECHDRGAILVGAVFGAFIETYENRIADLLRIATAGTGQLAAGHVHPDLIARIAGEATATARRFLTICVRAFDYLPVLDVTFGDFLRALVTADRHLFPDDGAQMRARLVDAFRKRGIYPETESLAEGSLVWSDATHSVPLPGVAELVRWTAEDSDLSTRRTGLSRHESQELLEARSRERAELAEDLHAVVNEAPARFGFHRDVKTFPVALSRFHASFRPSQDGQSRADVVIELLQHRPDLAARPELEGTGIDVWAGTTVVADALGRVRHIITKPLPGNAGRPFSGAGGDRFQRMCEFVSDVDSMDVTRAWTNQPNRVKNAFRLATVHRRRVAGPR